MSRPTLDAHSEALSWARHRSGFDLETAASRLQITEVRLKALEAGEELPTPAKIREMSKLYRVSPVVFFLDRVPSTGFKRPSDFRTVASSEVGRFSPQLRKEIDRVRAQLTYMKELAEESVVTSTYRGLVLRKTDPHESSAESIRDWLGVDATDRAFTSRDPRVLLQSWIEAIEAKGILVTQVSGIPVTEMRGFCVFDSQFPLIVLNGADIPSPRLFTLVHELVHILEGEECVCGGILGDRGSEVFSNSVAAATLMPAPRVQSLPVVANASSSTRWSLDQLADIAAPFGVSREAALRRLLTLGLTTERHYQQIRNLLQEIYSEQQSGVKSTGGPDRDDMILRNLGRPYIQAVLRARNLGIATDSEVADRLFAKVRWVEVLAERLDMVRQ